MAEEIVLPIGGSERKNPPHLSRGNDALHCAAGVVRQKEERVEVSEFLLFQLYYAAAALMNGVKCSIGEGGRVVFPAAKLLNFLTRTDGGSFLN